MSFFSKAASYGGLGGIPGAYLTNKKFRNGANEFLMGKPEGFEEMSTLRDTQEPLYDQLQRANMERGAGGSFGTAADYYRDLMSNDSEDFNAFAAPEMRRFNEETIPGLSRQFAGFGAGASGLSGSGYRNAAVNAGTDLSERLGQIRAQLRQQGAQGLQNLGQQGLGQYKENIYRPAQPGLIQGGLNLGSQVLAAKYGGKLA